MRPYFKNIVPGPLWVGRQSEKTLRDVIIVILDKKASTLSELANYLVWPEKALKPHLKALQRKGRIQEYKGTLFTKKKRH